MSGFVLSPDAAQDIDSIWEYIARDSLEAADRVIAGFLQACEMLSLHPLAGHSREDLAEDRPFLFWPVGEYLIIYRHRPDQVQIVAVVHGRRDIPKFLRQRPTAG